MANSLVRVLPAGERSWPLHGVAASRAVEQAQGATLPPHTLMHRAGLATARLALAIAPGARRVWVAAGPGNNGGDGLHAAIELRNAGLEVQVSLLADPQRLPADARDAWQRARQAGVPMSSAPTPVGSVDLVIDALLGLGVSRAPEGVLAEAIRACVSQPAPVLSVDLPSGLDAERGVPLGAMAVQAGHTLSLLTLKPGLFTGQGRDHSGCVWFDALGTDDRTPPRVQLTGQDCLSLFRAGRHHAQHKGSFGDLLVVGGAEGMTGAAWLAARAALIAGAGRVYVDSLAPAATAPWPELMCRPGLAHDAAALERATVVCGCGGGDAVAELLPTVLRAAARLVLDADALNAIATDADLLRALQQRATVGQPTLLTPHPLEAARLLGTDTASVQHDRCRAAQQLADHLGCAVLLKGSGSVCAAPGEPLYVNPTGNALLATAGTGDVLAGWSGGWWATQPGCSPQRLGAATAWWHGRAADLAADAGRLGPLPAGDLIDAMAGLRG